MLVENAINKSNKEKRNNFYERYIDVLKNYISVNDYHYKLPMHTYGQAIKALSYIL